MIPISCGWQYIVYRINSARVRKVKHSTYTRYLFIFIQLFFHFFWNPFLLHRKVIAESKRVQQEMYISNTYIKSIYNKIPLSYFGNPVFINDTDYEQDKVTPLKKFLKSSNINKILDAYIKLIHTLWTYEIGETVFRFTANNGVNKDGEVIQMDFGEITHDIDQVLLDIREKRWVKFSKYLDKKTKIYYLKRMEEEMTEEKLHLYWGTSL